MAMCGGDGFADVIGRRFGRSNKLSKSSDKSVAGTVAMFVFGLAFGLLYIAIYEKSNNLSTHLFTDTQRNWRLPSVFHPLLLKIEFIILVATMVEALPFSDIDNISVTATILLLTQWLV